MHFIWKNLHKNVMLVFSAEEITQNRSFFCAEKNLKTKQNNLKYYFFPNFYQPNNKNLL